MNDIWWHILDCTSSCKLGKEKGRLQCPLEDTWVKINTPALLAGTVVLKKVYEV